MCNLEIVKKPICFILFLFSLFHCNWARAQFILAGEYTANDYFHDINPDTVLKSAIPNGGGNVISSYYLDVDGDSKSDFKITNECECLAKPIGLFDISISALNNFNKIAFSHIDSCTGGGGSYGSEAEAIAFSFNYADTIKNAGAWKWTDTAYAYYYFYDMDGKDCIQYIPDTFYIGFRLINASDTLYGWLCMYFYDYKITLQEYACNKKILGILENMNNKISMSVYPNPSSTFLTVQTSLTQAHPIQISLLNLLGQIVSSSDPPISPSYSIDVDDLPKAIYIVQVQDILTGEVGRQKVVIQ